MRISCFMVYLLLRVSYGNHLTHLVVLHSNDIHGNFAGDEDGFGGFPKTIHMIKKIKAASTPGNPVIYLNAGDIFTGTVWYSIHRTAIAADFMKLLKPDALTLGNHEFDEGLNGLESFARQIDQPLLCANGNFTEEPTISKYVRKSIVLKPNNTDHEIGIIGYINSGTGELTNAGRVNFGNDIEAVREEALHLTSKGVKIIIALGHSGIETDKKIAKAVPEVDIVVGGHTHTLLYNGNPPTRDKVYGEYPVVVQKENGVKVPVVQLGSGGKYLGKLNVTIDSEGNVLEFEGNPIVLDSEIAQDEEALELLDYFRSNVTDLKEEVLAISRVFLQGGYHCRTQECNFGNLMTDAFCEYKADKYDSGPHWTDTPIALVNAGTFATSINASKQEGNVTAADLYAALPFGDKLVTLNVNASTLLQILEYSVKSTGETTHGEFLQVSGLKIVYDMEKPPFHRVVDLMIRCAECDIPHYERIKMNSTYRLTTTTFISKGGDGYDCLKSGEEDRLFEEVTDLEVVRRHIALSGIVQASLDNRIRVYNDTNLRRNGVVELRMPIYLNFVVIFLKIIYT